MAVLRRLYMLPGGIVVVVSQYFIIKLLCGSVLGGLCPVTGLEIQEWLF